MLSNKRSSSGYCCVIVRQSKLCTQNAMLLTVNSSDNVRLFPTIAIYLLLISWNLTTQCMTVTGDGSVGECGRLSQLGWSLGAL